MSDNSIVLGVIILALAAHLAAFAWLTWTRRDIGALLCCNLAVSAAVLVHQVSRLRYILLAPVDWAVMALLAFEAVVLVMAAWSFGGRRVPGLVSCAAGAVHLVACAAALLFMLTFRMTRLI